MPPDKRNKGFSPYTYTVQYARPGAGPVQAARPYVNMAIQGEDHYVVSKKDPEWFVYASNVFNYNLSDDCELIFDKATTELKVVHKSAKLKEEDATPPTQVEVKTAGMKLNVKPSSSYSHQWIELNKLKISHTLGRLVDCIVIADSKYVTCRKKFIQNEAVIVFSDSFKFTTYNSLHVILYQIDGDASKFSVAETTGYEYSPTTRTVSFENLFNGTDCVPLVFDRDGYAHFIRNADLLPNRVIVSADAIGVLNRAELESEKSAIEAELAAVRAAQPDPTTPVDYLYQQDPEYRRLKDRLTWIDDALASFSSSSPADVNVANVMEYSFDECAKAIMQYGVDRTNVAWNGNTAIVTHNLDGLVNFVLDGSVDYASSDAVAGSEPVFSVSIVDENRIAIEFNSPVHPVCTLKMFKVGDML